MNFTKYLIVFSLVRRQNSQRHPPLAGAGPDDEIENRQANLAGLRCRGHGEGEQLTLPLGFSSRNGCSALLGCAKGTPWKKENGTGLLLWQTANREMGRQEGAGILQRHAMVTHALVTHAS